MNAQNQNMSKTANNIGQSNPMNLTANSLGFQSQSPSKNKNKTSVQEDDNENDMPIPVFKKKFSEKLNSNYGEFSERLI